MIQSVSQIFGVKIDKNEKSVLMRVAALFRSLNVTRLSHTYSK